MHPKIISNLHIHVKKHKKRAWTHQIPNKLQAQLKLPQIIPSTESHRLKYKVPEEGGGSSSEAAAMPEGGKKKLPGGLGVGGGSTHMNPPSEEGKREPRGGVGVTRREAEAILVKQMIL